MIVSSEYNRFLAREYAEKWAYRRNPRYYDFENIGGDCTNFASQCLYAGSGVMNYPAWYYYSIDDRSPSWTGVEFLYDFLIKNKGLGPRGEEVGIEDIMIGDLIQLSFNGERFAHTLVVIKRDYPPTPSGILVATHTYDSKDRALDTYNFSDVRFIHIKDVGKEV